MAEQQLIAALNATILSLTEQLAAASAGEAAEDPCAPPTDAYSIPLHVGAVFVILAVSAAGVLSILAGKRCAALRVSPLALALGKTAGTGIVLATALVHMLQPANAALTSECVPAAFHADYAAYAFLFALLAALAVQTLHMLVGGLAAPRPPVASSEACTDKDCQLQPTLAPAAEAEAAGAGGAGAGAAAAAAGARVSQAAEASEEGDGAPAPHSHKLSAERSGVLALLGTEAGFTVHSVLIGLAVGVAADGELGTLLVALSFHQFFEGVALGARLLDSSYSGATQAALALLFAAAAPIGIGAGAGAVSHGGLNTSGADFLLTQGVSDGVCAGILLHIGFSMAIKDFPEDTAKVAAGAGAGLKRAAMMAALWGGAGAMAFLGRYL